MTNKTIKKICKEKNIVFHHVDTLEKHGEFGTNFLGLYRHKPIQAIVYSSQYGHWALAIFKDGTSLTFKEYYLGPCEKLLKLCKKLSKK